MQTNPTSKPISTKHIIAWYQLKMEKILLGVTGVGFYLAVLVLNLADHIIRKSNLIKKKNTFNHQMKTALSLWAPTSTYKFSKLISIQWNLDLMNLDLTNLYITKSSV